MADEPRRPPSDGWFLISFSMMGGAYIFFLAAILVAQFRFIDSKQLWSTFTSPEIQYATLLSLATATLSTMLALLVAVPLGYLLSRCQFVGKWLIEAFVDVPMVLPPLVVGLGLLLLFQSPIGVWLQSRTGAVTFQVPSIVIAQFTVVTAIATRTMRATFDFINRRTEDVACTLGCSRGEAFWSVTFPQSRRGLVTAGTLAWARAFGEFGPVFVFSGTTRLRTEVLPTSIYLELNRGHVESAAAVSLLMVLVAGLVLVIARRFGFRGPVA